VHWVNDDRLVFGADDARVPADRRKPYGMWAVNRDGSDFRQLVKRKWTETFSEGNSRVSKRVLEPDHYFFATVAGGGDEIVVAHRRWDNVGARKADILHRLDTRTGITRPAVRAPDDRVTGWALDLNDEPRAAISRDGDRVRLYWRASAQ